MYASTNFKTKKALREAVKAGHRVRAFSNGPYVGDITNGKVYLEGPWFPEPHRWYAEAWLEDGYIVKVR